MKNYSWKIIKSKSLIFNCILILALYILMQIAGILICYTFFRESILAIISIMVLVNLILYKVLVI
ncbi:Uncharacterised protein [uncultured Clostridium sp.]|nr:Uncharacterised protein [uncultured Clostridium sp.]